MNRAPHLWLVEHHERPTPMGTLLRSWIGAFTGTDATWSARVVVQGVLAGFDNIVIAEPRDERQVREFSDLIEQRGAELSRTHNRLVVISPYTPDVTADQLRLAHFILVLPERETAHSIKVLS